MEIQLKSVSYEAGKYDVRKSVELVLHGPDGEGSDLWDPNDREYKGRKPNFKVVMGESPSGRLHDGTAILCVTTKLGERLLQWKKDHNILVCGRPLHIFNNHQKVPRDVKQTLEKARYIDSEQDRRHTEKAAQASQVRLRIADIQIGVWYRDTSARQNQRRAFSVEYKREFLHHSAAYISLVYEHSLIRIDVSVALFVDACIKNVYPT